MLIIRPFEPQDQETVKSLILAGLVEHWGWLDSTKNPDLECITKSYACGIFLTAWLDGELVGTGALIPDGSRTGRIVRMSTDSAHRRQRIASEILKSLIAQGQRLQYQKIILETTSTWQDAINFYLHHGFVVTHNQDGDTHFELELLKNR